MKAVETNFLKFLQGAKQFVIPIYQRAYSWDRKQCKQLWDDIMRAGGDDRILGHFVGSIVYIQGGLYQSSSVSELVVIDGQQRLTTLSLLLKCIVDGLNGAPLDGDITAKKIANYYLLNAEEENELRLKLILNKIDKETYLCLVENRELPRTNSKRIIDNYHYFRDLVGNGEYDLNQIYRGIKKLFIVDISLEREKDNPQLIFESLNSTGLELSQADLIRNFVLMGLEPKRQERIFTEYWFPMENDFEQIDFIQLFNRFIRDFLTIKLGKIPRTEDVYSNFKSYINSTYGPSIEEMVKEIRYYSRLFTNLSYLRFDDKEIGLVVDDINELQVEVSYPFLMHIFRDYEIGVIDKTVLLSVLNLVESYVFRRAVCDLPSNSLNKIFANLYKEIDQTRYLESLKAAFVLKEGLARFPSDDEFTSQLPTYKMYNRLDDFALRKLENSFHSKEPISIDDYTVEHIMPKELSELWVKSLGTDFERIHQKYLDTLGNLTLTGYNSELGNSTFREKRDRSGGYASSSLMLNKDLAQVDRWGLKEIEGRANRLTELSLRIWPFPTLEEKTLAAYRSKMPSTNKVTRTEEEHLEKASDHIKRVYEELKAAALSIGDEINVSPQKYYIAFYHRTNFVDVIVHKSQLNLTINMTKGTLIDPESRARDVSEIGHWGNGHYEFIVKNSNSIEYAVSLIKQSYDRN